MKQVPENPNTNMKLDFSGDLTVANTHERYLHASGATMVKSAIMLASELDGNKVESEGYYLNKETDKKSSVDLTLTLLDNGDIELSINQVLPDSEKNHSSTQILTKSNN